MPQRRGRDTPFEAPFVELGDAGRVLASQVLGAWLRHARDLRARYNAGGPDRDSIEARVRVAVAQALDAERRYGAQGLTRHEARELTRASLWIPPSDLLATGPRRARARRRG